LLAGIFVKIPQHFQFCLRHNYFQLSWIP
jgi:hypothetical protein